MTNAELADLQAKMDALSAQATKNTDAEASAVGLLSTLGQLIINSKNDPAAIAAIGTAMTNTTGQLTTSADTLAAAIVAGTPAA